MVAVTEKVPLEANVTGLTLGFDKTLTKPPGPTHEKLAPLPEVAVRCNVAPTHCGLSLPTFGAAGIGKTVTGVTEIPDTHPNTVCVTE